MLDNAGGAWALGLGLVFTFDGVLILSGHRSLSAHARAHPVATVAGFAILAAHFVLSPERLRL